VQGRGGEAGVSSSRPPASSSCVLLGSARGRRPAPLSPPNQWAVRRSAARSRSPLDRLSGGLEWSGDPTRNGPGLDWIGLDWFGLFLPRVCWCVTPQFTHPSIHPSWVAALLGCISSDELDCLFHSRSDPEYLRSPGPAPLPRAAPWTRRMTTSACCTASASRPRTSRTSRRKSSRRQVWSPPPSRHPYSSCSSQPEPSDSPQSVILYHLMSRPLCECAGSG
jgi:hypothetical protein